MQNEVQVSDGVSQEAQTTLAEIFDDPFNCYCYQCGRKAQQWVETELTIFLCLQCSGLYKSASELVNIKCTTLDVFSSQQLKFIKNGGNRKMKEFLSNYQMHEYVYRQILQTKAIDYYRAMLKEEFNGRMPPMAPQPSVGRQFSRPVKSKNQISPSQVFQKVKGKTVRAGEKALELGGKAITSIQTKISSGELKQDVKHAGESISSTAKGLWGSLSTKVNGLRGEKGEKKVEQKEKLKYQELK